MCEKIQEMQYHDKCAQNIILRRARDVLYSLNEPWKITRQKRIALFPSSTAKIFSMDLDATADNWADSWDECLDSGLFPAVLWEVTTWGCFLNVSGATPQTDREQKLLNLNTFLRSQLSKLVGPAEQHYAPDADDTHRRVNEL